MSSSLPSNSPLLNIHNFIPYYNIPKENETRVVPKTPLTNFPHDSALRLKTGENLVPPVRRRYLRNSTYVFETLST